ncbi:hypothetical protein HK101_007045, partial [Irineochytrium annulatum]
MDPFHPRPSEAQVNFGEAATSRESHLQQIIAELEHARNSPSSAPIPTATFAAWPPMQSQLGDAQYQLYPGQQAGYQVANQPPQSWMEPKSTSSPAAADLAMLSQEPYLPTPRMDYAPLNMNTNLLDMDAGHHHVTFVQPPPPRPVRRHGSFQFETMPTASPSSPSLDQMR